jgi:hypothetical protein
MKTESQVTLFDLIEAALERMTGEGLQPASIYLDAKDYEAFAHEYTERRRASTGSGALFWPLSYGDVPLVNEKVVEKIEKLIPVRPSCGPRQLKSAAYASNGVPFPIHL